MTTARDGGAVIVGNAFVIFCIVTAKQHDLDRDVVEETAMMVSAEANLHSPLLGS